jgi:hypothetical protein
VPATALMPGMLGRAFPNSERNPPAPPLSTSTFASTFTVCLIRAATSANCAFSFASYSAFAPGSTGTSIRDWAWIAASSAPNSARSRPASASTGTCNASLDRAATSARTCAWNAPITGSTSTGTFGTRVRRTFSPMPSVSGSNSTGTRIFVSPTESRLCVRR